MTEPAPPAPGHFSRGRRQNGDSVVSASEVKQAGVGGRIVLVLIVALALTAIGFSVIGLGWRTPLEATESNDGKQAVDTAAFQEKERSIPQADAPVTPTGEPTRPPTGDAPNVNAPVTSVVPSTR